MHSFVYGILGGTIIGLAAAILLLFSGDILGASGIISSVTLSPISSLQDSKQHWKLVFLACFLLTSHLFLSSVYDDKENGLASLSWAAFLIGGFFVGFGTKLGNGCTSGHGICGLARFSMRSLLSVCTFMVMGALTSYLTQEATTPFSKGAFDFLRSDPQEEPLKIWTTVAALVSGFVALIALVAPSLSIAKEQETFPVNDRAKLAPAAVAGTLFAVGLYISQMVYPVRVLGFLNVGLMAQGDWDATLMFVMGGGLVISILSYQAVDGYNTIASRILSTSELYHPLTKPLALSEGSTFSVPCNAVIDRNLIFGAMSFGLGWGISGLCPGPAMVLAGVGHSWVLACYWPAFFVGALLAERYCSIACSRSMQEESNKTKAAAPPASTRLFDLENSDSEFMADSRNCDIQA